MHECALESAFLADAEVDSMEGDIGGRVGTGILASPCREEIDKAQEELRLEIDCREERLRELEFLEKGGDPLDFKFCNVVSASVQSTSLTDQHPDQIVTSKAKDGNESAAVQHEVAVESFGKHGDTTCEANSGDNLLLFDDHNKLHGDKNFKGRAGKSTVTPSEVLTRTGGNPKAKGSENAAIFRPYARRNRSKSNRDGARLGSVEASNARNQGSTHSFQGTRDVKGSSSDANIKDPKLPSICKLISSNRSTEMVQQNESFHHAESVVNSSQETLANVNGSLKELSSDAKSNGDLLGCIKDHEKPVGAGLGAEETTELTNFTSRVSGPASITQQPENGSQSDVSEMRKEITYTHPDSTTMNLCVQTHKVDSDAAYKLISKETVVHGKELIELTNEAGMSENKAALDIEINPKPSSAVKGDDRSDISNSSFIEVKEDTDLQSEPMTADSSKATEFKENAEIQLKKYADNLTDHKPGPIDVVAEVQGDVKSPNNEVLKTSTPDGAATNVDACNQKFTDKMDEDSILAQAKNIQAKLKRIADLSTRSSPLKNCHKYHWNFLLEEVAWLANDFMQERVWKVSAAAQLIRLSALSFRQKRQNQMPVRRARFVACSLAKSVTEFWRTCEMLDAPDPLEPQSLCKSSKLKSYALRFLRYNKSITLSIKVEVPVTMNDMHDSSMQETWGKTCIMEDDLLYAIPPGAMQCYRASIESYVMQSQKYGSLQKEDNVLVREVNEETMEMSQDNIYDEDEGGTSLQYLHGTNEWSKASHFAHRKEKGLKRTYSSGSYELGTDLAYGTHDPGTQKSVVMFKRSATQNLVSIPRKRMRTASRQRVFGSSIGAGTLNMLATNASSEDTNSYQDDQGSLLGGSQMQQSLEVESPVDFEKYPLMDSDEISTKQKKRKNDKNMGEHSKRRLYSHHHGSSGNNGVFGYHKPKKLKVPKQAFENMLDNGGPSSGSMPSPAASHMSNMSSANEYKRIIGYRDRFKKTKGTKLPVPMSGSGNAWTSFEDQALVVLVHDLGPHWHLVSDAINSTLQVKHIFRDSKDCKERHKLLMDQTAGDAADSADDSGSSQPYPSTMPGIPKGSARQLFQRLHGPMEEDMVKSHFEKIIKIGKMQYHHRKQYDSLDQKHVVPPHNSHMIAISQVSSNGGFLTPLDLIKTIMPSPDDLALGYNSPQTNGFTNQSCVSPGLPHGMPAGNSLSSPSAANSHWNGRYRVSMPLLPVDDQQRVQQSNSLSSSRNIPQSTTAVPGHPLSDRFGPRKFQVGNGMGLVNGITSRGNPLSRPPNQVLGSSAMLDSGGVHPSGMVAMQASSMHRHIDNSHQIRPGQGLEYHRPKLVPEMHMRATQVSGLNGSYGGQTGTSSGQAYSTHSHQKSLQQSHDLTNPLHPSYARLVKERQQQIYQQQQQYSASTQARQHLPVPIQGSSQVQSQSSQGISPSSPLAPINSQLQQKHHLPPHGLLRDSQPVSTNLLSQVPKQRQQHSQQQQETARPSTAQQRQQLQTQHGKQIKGEDKVSINPHVDQFNLSVQSLLLSSGSQSIDKDDQAAMGLGSSQNSLQSSRPVRLQAPSQSQSQKGSMMLDNGNKGISHQAISLHGVSSPNQPHVQMPSNSQHMFVDRICESVTGGVENSAHLSQTDNQSVNIDSPIVSNAATNSQTCVKLIDERSKFSIQQQALKSLQESPIQNVNSQSGFTDSPNSQRLE